MSDGTPDERRAAQSLLHELQPGVECPKCGGSGDASGRPYDPACAPYEKCVACDGTGRTRESRKPGPCEEEDEE